MQMASYPSTTQHQQRHHLTRSRKTLNSKTSSPSSKKDFTDLDQQIESLQERIEELDLHKEELEDVCQIPQKMRWTKRVTKNVASSLDQEQLQRQEKWQTKRLDEVEKEILKAVDTVKSGQQRLIEIDQLLADKQEVHPSQKARSLRHHHQRNPL